MEDRGDATPTADAAQPPTDWAALGRTWYPLAAMVPTAIAVLIWSWGTWPDPLVDFGRELYVPWRITEGEVLYRDIEHVYGPVSPYLNAFWLWLQGASLTSLVIGNILVLAALVALLFYLLRALSSRFAATVACVIFLIVFAAAQHLSIGNYNYLAPYSHEVVHGMVLVLGALVALHRYALRPHWGYAPLAGALMGTAYLTKHEVFVAGAAAVLVGLVALAWTRAASARRLAADAAVLVGSILTPPLVAFGLLWLAMPAEVAWGGVVGPYRYVFDPELASLPFFRRNAGFHDVPGNLRRMGIVAVGYAIAFVPPVVIALGSRAWPERVRRVVVGAVAAAVFVTLWLLRGWIAWEDMLRPLPVLLLIGAGVLAFRLRNRRGRDSSAPTLVLWAMTLVFSLAMISKLLLEARLFFYGFAMAMPACMLLVIALVHTIPAAIRSRGGDGRVFVGAGLAALAVATIAYTEHVQTRFAERAFAIDTGADRILANDRGPEVARVVGWLLSNSKPEETVLVVPEGATINFLAQRASPVRYTSFLPTDPLMYGEDRVLAELQTRPPDYLVWTPRDVSEYGRRGFGIDYGVSIADWLKRNYVPAEPLPPADGGFHMIIFRRATR
jgi:hypothetical protein